MIVRYAGPAPLTSPGAATWSGHLGVGTALIEKEQPGLVEIILTFKPGMAGSLYVLPLLFVGMGGLFLTV